MAKQIAGPNINVIKSGTESLSTFDLVDNKPGIAYRGADLGVDYSTLSNFIHFGSAVERLSHFKDKLTSIKYNEAQALLVQTTLTATPTYQSESINFYNNTAATLLQEFDGYDRYLYYSTGSTTWPKDATGSLYAPASSQGIAWYNNQLTIAQDFDLENQNRIINTLPDYIKEDNTNNPALVFCDMLGQHYDNLLIYADGISQKHNTDNRLDIGVSRDLVADTLKGFGVKLYQSQLNTTDLVRLYVGEFYPTGSEQINTMVSASNAIPSVKDQIDQTNKRIYHNLPHILQTKGTKRGLRTLINTFGIPTGNLRIKEFGGINTNGQNFSDSDYTVSSLEKVRTDNTGSYISGSTISSQAITFKQDTKYTQDLHVVEVGWSTNQQKDNFITGSLSSVFEIDNYIGDPRDRYNHTYARLKTLAETFLPNDQDNTLYDFLRLLKYFDNSIFSMLQDFVPARTSIRKGAIIKPHIIERSKMGVGFASQSRHEISGSIDMYTVDGGPSEAWDGHSTEWNTLLPTATGYVSKSFDDEKEKYDGELGGSTIVATTGEMNPNNPYKKAKAIAFSYDTIKFTNQNNFNQTIVSPGNMLLYYYDPYQSNPSSGGGGGPVSGSEVYSQSLDAVFLSNTNFDVDIWQVAVQKNGNYVASVSNPADTDVIYSTPGLVEDDEITLHIQAEDTSNIPGSITVEIKQGAVVLATHTATEIAFTNYTYTVPTLNAQGTSVTLNYRIT